MKNNNLLNTLIQSGADRCELVPELSEVIIITYETSKAISNNKGLIIYCSKVQKFDLHL